MKNIILVGLIYDLNLGDQAIYEMTRFEVEEIFKEKNQKLNIDIVDLYGRKKCCQKKNYILNFVKKVKNKIVGSINDSCNKVKNEGEKKINNNIDAIIFCGGGLIKYKQQKVICNTIKIVIQYAQKYNIPVMFSGVGVEGYDEDDLDCQKLKADINKECVKYITTRDNIDLLNKYYIEDKDKIISAKVSDCVCSINQLYSYKKKETNTIGLGMIRSNLFLDYGINYSDENAINLYKEIYYKIIESGKKCKFFTNGGLTDEEFAENLTKILNVDKNEILVERPKNTEDLIKTITSFEGIIVGRLHASIIAYSYNIPSIGLVWNQKQKQFGETIGYPNRFIEYENFNADKILYELQKALKEGYSSIDNEEYKSTNYKYLKQFITDFVFERK